VATALNRHLALVGFMGAGKTTIGRELAERLGRDFIDTDAEIERAAGAPIPDLFRRGEAYFREVEERTVRALLQERSPSVIALGGGAAEAEATRRALARHAFTVYLDVSLATAWERSKGTGRPLAADRARFGELYDARRPVFERVADAVAGDAEGAVLAAGGVHVGAGSLDLLAAHLPEGSRAALVTDTHVAGIHGAQAQLALAGRLASTHEVPPGEAAKNRVTLGRLWGELRLERRDVVVGVGGGSTTDVAGFAAATYMRGVRWVAVPTTLVGQVDAAIGGKTAIDLPQGKNLAGAFHWPAATVIDPRLLETLPQRERRNGLSELVKTGLLAGEPLWERSEPEAVRRAAAFKVALCLRDPHDRGPRNALNLGHTFAHALETASDHTVPHGAAVALGLLAALRLSGLPTDDVERLLRPEPVQVDRDRAWAALARDKKAEGGSPRLVLLEAPGKPRIGVELPPDEVRRALDQLIAE
jgi:shikimate kinase/3-dehydroquinate synthase